MVIKIDNITEAQAIALEDMLATWEYLGEIGTSHWTAFFADGDGNFRPNILIDGHVPQKTPLLTEKDLINHVKIKVAPTKANGLCETMWYEEYGFYMIDFNDIARRIKPEE